MQIKTDPHAHVAHTHRCVDSYLSHGARTTAKREYHRHVWGMYVENGWTRTKLEDEEGKKKMKKKRREQPYRVVNHFFFLLLKRFLFTFFFSMIAFLSFRISLFSLWQIKMGLGTNGDEQKKKPATQNKTNRDASGQIHECFESVYVRKDVRVCPRRAPSQSQRPNITIL